MYETETMPIASFGTEMYVKTPPPIATKLRDSWRSCRPSHETNSPVDVGTVSTMCTARLEQAKVCFRNWRSIMAPIFSGPSSSKMEK